MRRANIIFRLSTAAAITSFSVTVLPPVARAQQAQEPAPPDEVNPPTRVGALTRVQGVVSFHAAGADSWSPAAVNYPVTTGEGFWTQPGAEARIDVSDTDIVMAGGTELEIGTLDATTLVASIPQGEAYLRVRDVRQGETYTLVTPRGSVTIAAPGRYAVAAGDTGSPTRVTVLEGTATLGDGAEGSLAAGQAAEITGDAAPFQVQIVDAAHDAFIDHVLAEERPAPAQQTAAPALVAQMPGGAELADYGTWTPNQQYGDVWYPQVQANWVPYREGHWAYVEPWGWTWVDADPWGFAPFHYGRWADIDGRWGWIPGYSQPVAEAPYYPVYAPALVTFFGVGLAVGVTAALLSQGSVGWVPLGPNEPYRPWFRAGPQYVRDVNIRHVTNMTQITSITNNNTRIVNNVTINKLRNASGATVVPAAAMATSRSLGGVARRPTAQMLAQARPVIGRSPIPPTTATAGVTPAVARAVHAIPAPAGTRAERPAPGPVIRAQAPVPTSERGAPGAARRFATPPLAAAGTRPRAPEAGARPAESGARAPGPAVPALRPPGAAPPVHPSAEAPAVSPESTRRPGTPPSAARPEGAPGHEPARVEAPARPTLSPPREVGPAPREAGPAAAGIRPAERPAPRPAPAQEVQRPAPAPASRPAPTPSPAPEARRAAPPAFHPAPAPRPEARPAPAPRPAPPAFHPAPAPRPEARPAPAPRPAPPAFHPAPAPRPAPRPEARPAPAPRPAVRPAPREEKHPGQP